MTDNMQPSPPERPLIILLAGPTGVGKTECAIDLALRARRRNHQCRFHAGLPPHGHRHGQTQPQPSARGSRIICWMWWIPDEPFDAAQYLEQARPVIEALHGRGKMPLVVGGTGLYMKVLTRGICPVPPGDPAVKRQLLQELESAGPARLHEELLRIDPESARRIHSHDRQRIVRALEVFRVTGKPLSQWQAGHGFRRTPVPNVEALLVPAPRGTLPAH